MQTKIDRHSSEDIMSLTSIQEGMLFHYIRGSDSLEYHEQVSMTFVGDINPGLLQQAWDFIIEKNEMLRAVYRWKEIDKPVQII
jgi:hypothetical protein